MQSDVIFREVIQCTFCSFPCPGIFAFVQFYYLSYIGSGKPFQLTKFHFWIYNGSECVPSVLAECLVIVMHNAMKVVWFVKGINRTVMIADKVSSHSWKKIQNGMRECKNDYSNYSNFNHR